MWRKDIDELLEVLWSVEEAEPQAQARLEELLRQRGMEEALEAALKEGLAQREKGRLGLGPRGRRRAQGLVRGHRLAERLLHDVLDLSRDEVETAACRFEHLISPRAAESICILLGHPATCPHGRPIPRGRCCQLRQVEVQPLVVRASQLRVGEEGEVAYIGTREPSRMEVLSTLGILPGSRIRLEQRRPSYVVKVNQTHLGLDDAIVEELFVRRLPEAQEEEA